MADIVIKNSQDIEKMRIAGKLAAEVLEWISPQVKAGVTTDELNQLCHDYIVNEQQAIPAPLNYHGFPKSICTSVNYVVCHGIPGPRKLKDGDIVNLDVTVLKDGYHGDTSKMFIIGKPSGQVIAIKRIARQPVDGREVAAIGQRGVQRPEDLDDTHGGLCHRLTQVAAGR